MQAVMAGQPNVDFASPDGIVTAQIDETSGGLAVPACPARVVVTAAFKAGTQPSMPCPLHSPQAAPAPAVDQFGNPIALDTAGMPVTPESTATTEPLPPLTPEPGDTTLTGGYFRTDTAPPPPTTTTTTTSEPRRDRDQNRDRSDQPPPSTNTSEPPPSTNTSTSPPPPG
jgi:hypothetical protein